MSPLRVTLASDGLVDLFARAGNYIWNESHGRFCLLGASLDEASYLIELTIGVVPNGGLKIRLTPQLVAHLCAVRHPADAVAALGERILSELRAREHARPVRAPVLGWRAWRVSRRSPELRSLCWPGTLPPWPVGPYEAACNYRMTAFGGMFLVRSGRVVVAIDPYEGHRLEHDSPNVYCTCGIYACDTSRTLQRELASEGGLDGLDVGVGGVVRCWGKAVRHKRGWRVQYAEPLGLVQGHLARDLVEAVADHYGLAVWDTYAHAEAHLKEWS